MTLACWLLACGMALVAAVAAAAPVTRDDVWKGPDVAAELLLKEPWVEAAGQAPADGGEAGQPETQRQIVESLRCRGCHFFDAKEMAQMDAFAERKHRRARERRKLCLECHYRADICCH